MYRSTNRQNVTDTSGMTNQEMDGCEQQSMTPARRQHMLLQCRPVEVASFNSRVQTSAPPPTRENNENRMCGPNKGAQCLRGGNVCGNKGNDADERPRYRNNRQTSRSRPTTTGGYQPDYFDDKADMRNWEEHRYRQKELQRKDSSGRCNGPPGRRPQQQQQQPPQQQQQQCRMEFTPYVDSPPRPQPSPQSSPSPSRREMEEELRELDRRRLKMLRSIQCAQRMLLEEMQQQLSPAEDDHHHYHHNGGNTNGHHGHQQQQQQTPSPQYETSSRSSCRQPPRKEPLPPPPRPAAADRRRVTYIPPSPDCTTSESSEDDNDECCEEPQPRSTMCANPVSRSQQPSRKQVRVTWSPSPDSGSSGDEYGARRPSLAPTCQQRARRINSGSSCPPPRKKFDSCCNACPDNEPDVDKVMAFLDGTSGASSCCKKKSPCDPCPSPCPAPCPPPRCPEPCPRPRCPEPCLRPRCQLPDSCNVLPVLRSVLKTPCPPPPCPSPCGSSPCSKGRGCQ